MGATKWTFKVGDKVMANGQHCDAPLRWITETGLYDSSAFALRWHMR